MEIRRLGNPPFAISNPAPLDQPLQAAIFADITSRFKMHDINIIIMLDE